MSQCCDDVKGHIHTVWWQQWLPIAVFNIQEDRVYQCVSSSDIHAFLQLDRKILLNKIVNLFHYFKNMDYRVKEDLVCLVQYIFSTYENIASGQRWIFLLFVAYYFTVSD